MVLIPGNLSNSHLSCGQADCHPGIVHRVDRSLMNSMSGVICVNRFVFGESDTLSAFMPVGDLGDSPADRHLRQLCVSCHLGNEKREPGPVTEKSRGGGCNACHLNYSQAAMESALAYHADKADKKHPAIHSAQSLNVTDAHCFGCHSRSGRISTNFEGWHETRLQAEEVAGKSGFRTLADGRVFSFMGADIHHTAGLACIDCHDSYELMGDGQIYLHKEDAVSIRCGDCHFKGEANTVAYAELDIEFRKIMKIRDQGLEEERFVEGPESGKQLSNVVSEAKGVYLVGKLSGDRHPVKPPAEVCSRTGAHGSLSCSACHTAWAPQCVGCHTAFDPHKKGIDLLTKAHTAGKWEEYLGEFFAELPSLGVVGKAGNAARIKAFVPGMILSIDKDALRESPVDDPVMFRRLFAPAEAHTTAAGGRSCKSCHQDPLALGYGRGKLIYELEGRKGQWLFEAEYAADTFDGLPQDAWIPFLGEGKKPNSTRPGARPFDIAEQRKILTVGACLSCHSETSKVMQESLVDFAAVRRKISKECVLPEWEE
jgi:hypothetical protein